MRGICSLLVLLVTVGGIQGKRGLGRSRRAAVPVRVIPWPNGVIPYIIDRSTFTSQELKEISLAMETWNNETCVKFRPHQRNDRNWVRITDGTRCYSNYMGHKGLPGEQLVTLSKNGCRYYGLYLHELGHVIGLDHEHIRNDRDKYLLVDLSGVPENLRSFFKKKAKEELKTYNSPYDLQSVMHYGKSSFSVFANKAPIDVKNKETLHLLTDVYVKDISFWDAKIVNLHYKCQDKCQNIQPPCQEPGYVDNNCNCLTPADFSLRRCVDLIDEKECDRKADKLECYRNASYMVTFCRKTCRFCFKDRLGVTTNSKYTDQTTSASPKQTTTKTTTTTKPAVRCLDKYGKENCRRLRKRRFCNLQKTWMRQQCAATCSFCYREITTSLASAVTTIAPSTSSTRPPRTSVPTSRSAVTTVLQTTALKRSATTAPRALTTQKPQEKSKTLELLTVGLLAKEAWKQACQLGDPKGECPKSRSACKNITSFLHCPNICKNCELCEDTSRNCAALKRSGYCTRYASSTVPICRKTCDACFTD